MIKNKWIKILVLMTTLVFVSTAAYAKTGQPDSKNYARAWWAKPFFMMKETTGQVKALENRVSALKHKEAMIDVKIERLNQKIAVLEEREKALQSATTISNDQRMNNYPPPIICPGCMFYECGDDFAGFNFSGAYLSYAYFVNAEFVNTDFSGATLKMAFFHNSNLTGADFSGANLTGADFSGAITDGVIWSVKGLETTCPNGLVVTDGTNCALK